jgi:hypothetical protein
MNSTVNLRTRWSKSTPGKIPFYDLLCILPLLEHHNKRRMEELVIRRMVYNECHGYEFRRGVEDDKDSLVMA